jgi:hypothetical protein
MSRPKPAPDVIRGGHWFADKDMRNFNDRCAGRGAGPYREMIMIKRLVWLISLVALGVVIATAPAAARGGHGGHGGHGHGGGWRGGFGGGFGWGFGGGWGGYYSPYYYGPGYYAQPYYYQPDPVYAYPRAVCGSRWVKVKRHGQWVSRRVAVRCY